jgi:hypothetical protein
MYVSNKYDAFIKKMKKNTISVLLGILVRSRPVCHKNASNMLIRPVTSHGEPLNHMESADMAEGRKNGDCRLLYERREILVQIWTIIHGNWWITEKKTALLTMEVLLNGILDPTCLNRL